MKPLPMNELDRAIHAVAKYGPSALPNLYRALAEGTLCALLPRHPEVEGQVMELKNGMAFPFVRVKEDGRSAVAVFSSEDRVREGLKKMKVPPLAYSVGNMDARQLLEVVGKADQWIVLNKGCATGLVAFEPKLAPDIASGEAFKGGEQVGTESGRVNIIDPADYPTELVQPMFEVMRMHRNFRAAWIFERPGMEALPDGGRRYQVLVLMDPRDATVMHDLSMVIAAAQKRADDVGHGFIDETDAAYVRMLFEKAKPFFVAPDYVHPPGK